MSGPGKGKVGFYVDLPPGLAAAFRQYARGRGESISAATARAFEREMGNPPPPVTHPPLPPVPTADVPPVPKPKKRSPK